MFLRCLVIVTSARLIPLSVSCVDKVLAAQAFVSSRAACRIARSSALSSSKVSATLQYLDLLRGGVRSSSISLPSSRMGICLGV